MNPLSRIESSPSILYRTDTVTSLKERLQAHLPEGETIETETVATKLTEEEIAKRKELMAKLIVSTLMVEFYQKAMTPGEEDEWLRAEW